MAGIVTRYGIICTLGQRRFQRFMDVFGPVALLALVYTVIVLFGLQGRQVSLLACCLGRSAGEVAGADPDAAGRFPWDRCINCTVWTLNLCATWLAWTALRCVHSTNTLFGHAGWAPGVAELHLHLSRAP